MTKKQVNMMIEYEKTYVNPTELIALDVVIQDIKYNINILAINNGAIIHIFVSITT